MGGYVFQVKPEGEGIIDWTWSNSSEVFFTKGESIDSSSTRPTAFSWTAAAVASETLSGLKARVAYHDFPSSHNASDAVELLEDNMLPSQLAAASRVIHGNESVFLTGAAGVGKSFVLRWIMQEMRKKFGNRDSIAVTAATGVAALQIGGVTLHAFAGIGIGNDKASELYEKLSPAAKTRWQKARVLIIDEISMIDNILLQKCEYIARKCCADKMGGKELCWGGIQLVFVGDFFQLPPVGLGKFGQTFAFNSETAWIGKVTTVELTEIVRQRDPTFTALLNELRVGRCSPTTIKLLQKCHESEKPLPTDGILPTKLTTHVAMADEENAKKLAELPGESRHFKSQDHWGPNGVPQYTSTLENLAEHQLVRLLSLKVGAQVMYTKNNPNHGLVNGSRGVVIGFGPADEDWDDYDTQAKKWDGRNAVPIVKFDNGHVLAISSNYSTIFVGNAQCI